jgi:hypothetical protein
MQLSNPSVSSDLNLDARLFPGLTAGAGATAASPAASADAGVPVFEQLFAGLTPASPAQMPSCIIGTPLGLGAAGSDALAPESATAPEAAQETDETVSDAQPNWIPARRDDLGSVSAKRESKKSAMEPNALSVEQALAGILVMAPVVASSEPAAADSTLEVDSVADRDQSEGKGQQVFAQGGFAPRGWSQPTIGSPNESPASDAKDTGMSQVARGRFAFTETTPKSDVAPASAEPEALATFETGVREELAAASNRPSVREARSVGNEAAHSSPVLTSTPEFRGSAVKAAAASIPSLSPTVSNSPITPPAGEETTTADVALATTEIPPAKTSAAPESRFATGPGGERGSAGQANIAASAQEKFTSEDGTFSQERKSFVTQEREQLTTSRKSLGIDVAKSNASMSARFASASSVSPHPVSEYSVAAPVAASSAVADTPAPTAADFVAPTHHAVQAVLHAVEQMSTRDQKIVNLEFAVGDADLKVRVELHADEVRTTFHTDSPELREALSQEWQSVSLASSHSDRPVRLAPAVFTGSDSSSSNAFAGDTSSRQHEQNANRQPFESPLASVAHASSLRSMNTTAATETTAARPAHAVSATSLHLHTFA